MCTGACSRVVGAALWPFTLLCIVANVLLAFPDWKSEYVHNWGEHLTPEVLYLGGIVGGGIMVLVPAIHIQATGRRGCCGNRCGMFISVLFATIGLAGSLYAMIVSALGLVRGPFCQYQLENSTSSVWGRPFLTENESFSDENYLFDQDLWDICRVPEGVTEFNVILFSIILGSGAVELALCGIQVINGLFGCLCGTCNKEKSPSLQDLPIVGGAELHAEAEQTKTMPESSKPMPDVVMTNYLLLLNSIKDTPSSCCLLPPFR